MTIPQFRRWLEAKIAYLQDFPDGARHPDDHIEIRGLIDDAYNHAVELGLPECAEACKPGPVRIRLLECLRAIPASDVLTPPEIADWLATSPETVLGWIKSGQLKASNLATGNRPRYAILPDDLAAFLKSRQPDPPVKRKPKAKATGSYKRFSE